MGLIFAHQHLKNSKNPLSVKNGFWKFWTKNIVIFFWSYFGANSFSLGVLGLGQDSMQSLRTFYWLDKKLEHFNHIFLTDLTRKVTNFGQFLGSEIGQTFCWAYSEQILLSMDIMGLVRDTLQSLGTFHAVV